MWKRFAELAVEREFEVEPREYFRSFSNLSWAMAKIKYEGVQFWSFMEKLYTTELERTKLKDQPGEMTSAILATICFALKDCQPHDFSDDFWRELNSVLRTYLRDRSRQVRQGTDAN